MRKPPELDFSNYDEKQIGYELACALLEHQLKLKKQNDNLSQQIKTFKEHQDTLIQTNSSTIESKEPSIHAHEELSVHVPKFPDSIDEEVQKFMEEDK